MHPAVTSTFDHNAICSFFGVLRGVNVNVHLRKLCLRPNRKDQVTATAPVMSAASVDDSLARKGLRIEAGMNLAGPLCSSRSRQACRKDVVAGACVRVRVRAGREVPSRLRPMFFSVRKREFMINVDADFH